MKALVMQLYCLNIVRRIHYCFIYRYFVIFISSLTVEKVVFKSYKITQSQKSVCKGFKCLLSVYIREYFNLIN